MGEIFDFDKLCKYNGIVLLFLQKVWYDSPTEREFKCEITKRVYLKGNYYFECN